ncbi:2-acylglycerol O-acyltransferase 2-A-like [Amphiura filiformis]|uniref:2-acylglycerol O-acyltransferase 2-A-like n=1 Tax=Amphiura filiformis TaxID=82378 RepID=UPI003B214D51
MSSSSLTSGEGSGHKIPIIGVEIAPINVPYHRRAETFAVVQWFLSFFYFGMGSVILSILLLFTDYYWLSIFVYVIMIYDRHTPHTGGRSWDWFRRLQIWKHMANYFPVRLYKTEDLDPQHKYLFGFHPHGIIVCGGFVNFCTEATGFSQLFPGITPHLLSLSGFFQYPFAREYMLSTGLCAASSDSFDHLLGKSASGTAAIIVVGGAVEVLEAYPNHYSVYLSRRKGFVRKAIQHGAHLVPVYSFGETDVYDQYTMAKGSWKRWLQVKMNKVIGYPPIMFKGRGIFNYTLGILPYRRPINTVVGRPIKVKMNPHPTKEEINETHKLYMDSLTSLFDENKERFGLDKDEKLEII